MSLHMQWECTRMTFMGYVCTIPTTLVLKVQEFTLWRHGIKQ